MKTDKSLMSGSTTLLILSLLSGEEMYGYQMIVELARRSNHVFDLKEGTQREEGVAFRDQGDAVVNSAAPA